MPRVVLSEVLLDELDLNDVASTFNFPFAIVPTGVLKLMGEAYCHASLNDTLATALATCPRERVPAMRVGVRR